MGKLSDEDEKMLEVFTDWLNKHHEANNEDYRLTRDSYNEYSDPPRVLFDIARDGSRTIQLYANPYHDEGGPNILTGFFEYDDGIRFDNESKRMEPMVEPAWYLRAMVQEFDTLHALIWTDGGYNTNSLPQEVASESQ
jgi:hypothetical protein